jgi:branched-subunit amino acid transport protein
MSILLLLALAALTYASRAVAMVFLPRPGEPVRRVLDRVPAPLFAALAAVSLIDPQGGLVPGPTLAAAAGGVLLAPTRSLLAVLGGGLLGYLLGSVIW